MGAFLMTVLSFYISIAFFYAFYCWATKTDRSMAPIERRLAAAMYSLAWPRDLFLVVSRHTRR